MEYLESNKFGMITNYTEEDIEICKQKIKHDREHIKYKEELPCKNFKYPIENYIDLSVKGYTKQTIKLKTYCNYKPNTIPIAILFFIHGLGAHSNRESVHVANYLINEGFFVCSMDHREHGLSDEDLGYVRNFSDLVDDASKFVLLTEIYFMEKYDINVPKFICGSSMGGLITHYVSKLHRFQGVIYNVPCFDILMNCCLKMFVRTIGCMCPGSILPRQNGNVLSKNPNIIEDVCPIMNGRRPRFGTLISLMSQCDIFRREPIKSHENSLLIIAGGVDKIVSLDSIVNYYEHSNVKDKSIWLYPNMWHVSILEEEIFDIMPRLNLWMKQRLNNTLE